MSGKNISVIIPVYNREELLANCIESVLHQKGVSIEIIIIDDGSTDGTLQLCQGYASTNSNIKVIHQENSGISAARNAGLDAATGEYITFLDSDDIIPRENAFSEMYQAIRLHDVDAVVGEYDILDECGKLQGKGAIPEEYLSKTISTEEFWELNSKKECNFLFTVVWGKLYKREVWNNLRFDVNGRFAEDEYLLSALVDKCRYFYLIPKIVYAQVVSNESLSRSAFTLYKLNSPDSKLKTCSHLIKKGLYSCAVEKWGIAVGEVILMTKLVSDSDAQLRVKSLYDETCKCGKKLFKYMDYKKKVKFLAYRIGYPLYSLYAIKRG